MGRVAFISKQKAHVRKRTIIHENSHQSSCVKGQVPVTDNHIMYKSSKLTVYWDFHENINQYRF